MRGAALAEALAAVPFRDRDVFVDAILGIDGPPPDVDLPHGAVPYLPSGVDEILAMVRDVPLREDDELVDLGSGLGRVVILGHLLSGASARGIELQEHLVRSARACAEALDLAAVSFVHADAAASTLDGTVFFLYAPFNGAMLARAVARLEEVARRRSIVVCAVDLELREVPWLVPRATSTRSMTLYDASWSVTPRSSTSASV